MRDLREEDEGVVIVDEARGVGLGLGKEREKWEPVEAFSVDTLTLSEVCVGTLDWLSTV